MASESNLSNVLLTGQTAYTKKEGSMTNHGTVVIEPPSTNTARSFSSGFIDVDSVIKATKLEETTEYQQCETAMEVYLGEAFDSTSEGYTVINNANYIASTLQPHADFIQSVVNENWEVE